MVECDLKICSDTATNFISNESGMKQRCDVHYFAEVGMHDAAVKAEIEKGKLDSKSKAISDKYGRAAAEVVAHEKKEAITQADKEKDKHKKKR